MNSKLNEIIKAYLGKDNVDYAILLNGPWGCGKTFYVTNELKKIIEDNEYKFIYVSLYGEMEFKQILRKITYELLKNLNKKAIINVDFVNTVLEIGSTLPELGSIFSGMKNMKKIIEINKEKKIDITRCFFVFDDLERVSTNANRNDFMGLIYENYVKKGCKTLFVADESNIMDEDYYKAKEKIIRRTISYKPTFAEQIETFVEKNYDKPKQKDNLTKNMAKFIEYLNLLEITNLRTVSFIFDNYFEVIKNLADDVIEKHGDFIFRNIMILSQEFVLGKITAEDIVDKKNLDHITLLPDIWKPHEKKEKEKTYIEMFREEYNLKHGLNYVFVEEIFNFILTGYIQIDKLNTEITKLFKSKPEEESVIDRLKDFRIMEEKDLLASCKDLVSYLSSGYYPLIELPYLYTLLKFLENKRYLSEWVYKTEEIISKALEESSKEPKNIPLKAEISMGIHVFDESQTKSEYYNNLITLLKSKSAEKDQTEKKQNIEKIFNCVKQNDAKTEDYLKEYQYSGLFKDIVETDTLHHFLKISNKGIYYFELFLHKSILKVGNAGEYGYFQKAALEKIKEYLIDNIDKNNISHMRKIRLKEFIEMLTQAINHLEETKN